MSKKKMTVKETKRLARKILVKAGVENPDRDLEHLAKVSDVFCKTMHKLSPQTKEQARALLIDTMNQFDMLPPENVGENLPPRKPYDWSLDLSTPIENLHNLVHTKMTLNEMSDETSPGPSWKELLNRCSEEEVEDIFKKMSEVMGEYHDYMHTEDRPPC